MKRNKFIAKNFPTIQDPFIEGSLWWNKEWESGPWYLRRDGNGWIMGVDDGIMRDRIVTVTELTTGRKYQKIERGCGGGRMYRTLDEATREKILTEFEPFTNQKQL